MQLQQKEKAIQERAERQKMLKKGVDMLDQNNEIVIGRGGTTLSYWIRIKNALAYGIDIITPLRSKTNLI